MGLIRDFFIKIGLVDIDTPKLDSANNLNSAVRSDTMELITIDMIKMILEDEEVFKKFKSKKTQSEFFTNGLQKSDYIQAIKDYVDFFSQRLVTIDKSVLKRASSITGEKYKNVNEEGTSPEKLPELLDMIIAQSIYNTGSAREVLENPNYDRVKDDFIKALANVPKEFENKRLSLSDSLVSEIAELTAEPSKNEIIFTRREKFDQEKYKMNPGLMKLIVRKIPDDISDKGELAYEIYKAVYSTIEYESEYFIRDENPELKEQIRNRNVSEVTEKNRRAPCTTGAEIFSYMLSLYGIDSNIIKGTKIIDGEKIGEHWSTEIILPDDIIVADATKSIMDDCGNRMFDMSRLKLGMKPLGFISQEKERKYGNGEQTSEEAPGYILQKDVDEIMKMIEISDKSITANEVPISDKVEFLKDQLIEIDNDEIGNYATKQYIVSMFYKLFGTKSDKDVIGISSSLYVEEIEGIYSMYPIIHIKQPEGGYIYYIYDNEAGLKKTDIETIKQMVNDGKLNIIEGREKNIPGYTPPDIGDVSEKLDHIPDDVDDTDYNKEI